jgi:hypothetical protein
MAKDDEERTVSNDDILRVLSKNAATPSDPDDAETIRLFNEQQTQKDRDQENGKEDDEDDAQKDDAQRAKQPTSPPTQTTRKGRE